MMSISKLQKKIFKTVVPIVVICMLSIGMLAGCSEEKSEATKTSNKTAEEVTIIKNAEVEQIIGDVQNPTAVVFKDGKIAYVGDEKGAMKYKKDGNTSIIDAKGNTVMPNITEAHMHFATALQAKYEIDLADILSVKEMQDIIKKFVEKNPDLKVYAGSGWTVSVFENNSPTREILDKVCPDKPMIMQEVDGHAYWVNTKALEKCGIDKKFAERYNADYKKNGGRIVVDKNGDPTGHLKESAANLINKLKPDYTVKQCKEAIKDEEKWLAGIGITSAFDAGVLALSKKSSENYWTALKEMAKSNELNFRLRGSFWVQPYEFKNWEECKKYLDMWVKKANKLSPASNYKITTIKMMADQVLEEGTAYMSKGMYADNVLENGDIESNNIWANKGYMMHNVFEYAAKNGLNLHIHQIGDEAATFALNELEKVEKQYPELKNNRVCFAHCQFIKDSDKKRMKELGVAAIVAPYWAVMDDYYWDVYLPIMSSKTALDTQYPMNSLIKNGINIAFHSDYVVTKPDMGWLYYSAQTRTLPQKIFNLWYGKDTKDYIRTTDKNKSQDPKEYTKIKLIGPLKNWDEALSLDDTLKASTINGAKTINLDKEIGSIEVGKKADVMILNMNIRKVSIDEIENVKPVKTFFEGKPVYTYK